MRQAEYICGLGLPSYFSARAARLKQAERIKRIARVKTCLEQQVFGGQLRCATALVQLQSTAESKSKSPRLIHIDKYREKVTQATRRLSYSLVALC